MGLEQIWPDWTILKVLGKKIAQILGHIQAILNNNSFLYKKLQWLPTFGENKATLIQTSGHTGDRSDEAVLGVEPYLVRLFS